MKEGLNPDCVQSLCIIFFYVIAQQVVSESISWYYVYRHEDYKDLCEKSQNLNQRIKELKDALLYGTGDDKGVKRKQQERMLKVQEENFKDVHR
jgi:hypothetical protein